MEFVCFLFIPLSTCVTDWCFLYPSLRRALFSSLTFITLLFVNEVKKKRKVVYPVSLTFCRRTRRLYILSIPNGLEVLG